MVLEFECDPSEFNILVGRMRSSLKEHKLPAFAWKNILNTHNLNRSDAEGGAVNQPITDCVIELPDPIRDSVVALYDLKDVLLCRPLKGWAQWANTML